jgi:hypothetical protein
MFKPLALVFALSSPVMAEEPLPIKDGPCMDAAMAVNHSLFEAWALADVDVRGPGRDAIWSTKEFSKPYTEIMKQIPGKFPRTRGVFEELQDRITYTYKKSATTAWQNREVHRKVSDAYSWLYHRLAKCYK